MSTKVDTFGIFNNTVVKFDNTENNNPKSAQKGNYCYVPVQTKPNDHNHLCIFVKEYNKSCHFKFYIYLTNSICNLHGYFALFN